MSAPTQMVAEVAEYLINQLQREREAQTPELDIFADRENEHDYKYICEQEQRQLDCDRVNRLRKTIPSTKYHQTEVDFYNSLLASTIHEELLSKYKGDGELTLTGLLEIKESYIQKLATHGITGEAIAKKRLEIEDQGYWELEAELLLRNSSLRESAELAKRARRQHAETKRKSGSGRIPTRKSTRIANRTTDAAQSLPKSGSKPKPAGRRTGRVAKR